MGFRGFNFFLEILKLSLPCRGKTQVRGALKVLKVHMITCTPVLIAAPFTIAKK